MSNVIKEIYAPGKKHKVLIVQKDNGQFRLESSSLYEYEDIKAWEDTTIGLHLHDDLVSAEKAAIELLRTESGEKID